MSFSTDLYYLMHNDASLNAWCNGGIHYEHLPENFEITNNWIVYSFNKVTQANCLNSPHSFTTYSIVIKIVATDTLQLELINDYTVHYLNGKSYGGFEDIVFTGDDHTLDLDKNLYMNSLSFTAQYIRTSYV